MAADGTIVIDTHIDTSGVDGGTAELKQAFKRITASLSGLKKAGQNATKQTTEAFTELNWQANKFESRGVPTQKYREIQAQIEAAQERLKGLNKVQDNFLAAGGSGNSAYFEGVQKEIIQVTAELEKAQKELQQLVADGKAFTLGSQRAGQGGATAGFSQAGIQGMSNRCIGSFQRLITIVEAYSQSLAGASAYTGMLNSAVGGLGVVLRTPIAGLQNLGTAMKRLPSAVIEAGIAGIKKGIIGLSTVLRKVVKEAQKAALALAQLAGRGMIGGLKKLSAGVFGLTKGTQKAGRGLGGMLGTSLLLGTAFMAVYAALRSLKEGMDNLARYSDETNAILSSLMSSLTQLKNAFATAFSPILTAVAPALLYLINLLTTATTAVSHFMAAIGGKDSYIRASKVQQDYAASLKDTAEAATKAEGALASFDRLNVMPSGSVNSGGGTGELSPEEMFETVPVESTMKNMADRLKALIHSEDWAGLGAYIASGINAGLQKIYDAINWETVGPKITYFVNAFTSTFNSLVDNIDWELLGKTVGAGINTIVNTLLLFVDGIDWENLGKKLAEGANGLVDEINWENLGRLLMEKFNILAETLYGFAQEFNWNQLGTSIGQGINGAIGSIDPSTYAGALSGLAIGILDTINGILLDTDWQALGNKIADFFAQIDYSGIADSLFYGLGAALASVGEFVYGVFKDSFDAVKEWFAYWAEEEGGNWALGILDGILFALLDIGQWIIDHVFTPIVEGFKDAFGINSPSTVMAELGGFLIEGLLGGITELLPDVIGKFTQLKEDLSKKWDEIKQDASTKWNQMTDDLSTTWENLKKDAGTAFDSLGQKVDEAWEDINESTSDWWGEEGISGVIAGCVEGILRKIESLINGAIDFINGFIEKLNGLSIELPGGEKFGVNIPELEHVYLPRLASGTVVPPRAGEFAAILGDNRRETEVVSPLSTMKQALKDALMEVGKDGGGDIAITLNLDGNVVYETVVKRNRMNIKRTGKNALMT